MFFFSSFVRDVKCDLVTISHMKLSLWISHLSIGILVKLFFSFNFLLLYTVHSENSHDSFQLSLKDSQFKKAWNDFSPKVTMHFKQWEHFCLEYQFIFYPLNIISPGLLRKIYMDFQKACVSSWRIAPS